MTDRLPDFLIAGTMKSGTTSLSTWLSARADVHLAPGKEIHYFNSEANYARGPEWYAAKLAAPPEPALAFEATPLYCFYPEAVERMKALLPDAKVVVCLRDPVARAYSHYRHFYDRRASEGRTFEQAVEDELAADVERPGELESDPYGKDAERYVAQGIYLPQLERLQRAMGRDNVHVVLMEQDIQADPAGTFRRVSDFLGLPRVDAPEPVGERANAHFEYRPKKLWRFLVRNRVFERMPDRLGRFVAIELMRRQAPPAPMPPASRERLAEFYAPYNAALAERLGRELLWQDDELRHGG